MQLETYWAEIKNQSKAITGVSKVSLGLFAGNASGVGSALTAVTKAKKPADAVKAASKAKTTIASYLSKVHKVEAKRKDLSSPQKQSMDIIEKALGKITKELDALTTSGGTGGTGKDRNASEDAIWFKVKDAAIAHLKMREDAAKEALSVLKGAQEGTAELKNIGGNLLKAVKQAEESRRSGNMQNNMMAFDLVSRWTQKAEEIEEHVRSEIRKKCVDGQSLLMKAREDFKLPDGMNKAKADEYKKKSNEAFHKGDDAGKKSQALLNNIEKAVIQLKTAAEKAEAHSMQGKDPSAYTKRIDEMKGAIKTVDGIATKVKSAEGLTEKINQFMPTITDPALKQRALGERRNIITDYNGRTDRALEICAAVETRARQIPKEIAEYPQIKSALAEIAKSISDHRRSFTGWSNNLKEAQKALAKFE